jgi:glycine oxidase
MTDCLIIGGGIIGMLTARELCLGGARVTLVEKGETARESSWAGGGILSPLYPWRYPDTVTRLARYSQEHYRALAEQLLEDTGIDPEYVPSGMLMFDETELDRGLEWARRWDMDAEMVSGEQAQGFEPELKPPSAHALWFPGISQIRNPRLTRAVRSDIERRGAVIRSHTPVSRIRFSNGRAVGAETPGGLLTADEIIVCAGAWTADLLGKTQAAPEIEPVRGQMVMFHARPDLLRHITLAGGRYAIPRRDGRILFGSTLEHTGFDKATTADARDELYAAAVSLFPALQRVPIENHWAGLRPGAPAGIPYIGRHPQAENLYVNAGHYRNGVVLGLASARLAADIVLRGDPILDPAPFGLATARPHGIG